MAKNRVLFIRSAGGVPGLDVHVGMWQALEKAGIRATDCSGTSAGAIVSAFDARGYSAAEAARIISGLSDADVRNEVFAWKLRVAWLDYFLENEPILHLLGRYIPGSSRELKKPLATWATRLRDNALIDVQRECSDPRVGVLASMSICAVFPKVAIGGELYSDGGTRSYLGIPPKLDDYDEIYVLIAAGPPSAYRKKSGILTNAFMTLGLLQWGQIEDQLNALVHGPHAERVKVIWPQIAHPRGFLHFDHAAMKAAYEMTRDALLRGR